MARRIQISDAQLNELLLKNFYSWRPYNLVLARLERVHGIKRSLTWLKEKYKQLNVSRRKSYVPVALVKNCIRRELRTSNCQVGYRAMWKLIRDKYFVIARRDTVMEIMREVDPRGVALRQSHRLTRRIYLSRGPNYCWHMDNYDKLTPFDTLNVGELQVAATCASEETHSACMSMTDHPTMPLTC